VVQNGCLGGSRGGSVVMARDGMEELREDGWIVVTGALLDHPQAEVDVAEQPALLVRPERRAAAELADAPDVVQERGREQEIVAEPWMQLCGFAAERRDAHGVLEQSARVAVVPVGTGCRKRAKCLPDLGVANERAHHVREAVVSDLRCEELEEAVELVGVATERGRELGRVGVLCRLDGPDLHLELAAKTFHATEDVHGVAFTEALIEQVDVVPDPRLHASARVRELESEVRGSGAGAPTLLLRHREDALDGPVLGEVGDRGHGSSLFLETVGTLAAMADIQPFRAVRYSGAAGALADLVAPPYDAVDDDERARLYTRSPYNVVHLTLPETAEDAGRLYREWLASGILGSDEEPASWVSVESYVGPDGVSRERHGTIVSLAAEPYETGTVLPHERTHELIREERLLLLRATLVQPEPILMLADGRAEVEVPPRRPDVEVNGTRLWRSPHPMGFDPGQLLIADGHHRYESAVELTRDPGAEPARIMALVVSSADAGLHAFPTHRVFSGRPDLAQPGDGESCSSLAEALRRLDEESRQHAVAIAYRRGSIELARGEDGELDAELVDRHGLDGIGYTPRLDEATAAVDTGAADVAFLLREPRVETVFATARAGRRMPQKSTYFYPKPLSGLLFHPVLP
jgi:uncharacterized protein (DUF1015 family)